jgi:hypothetical protein
MYPNVIGQTKTAFITDEGVLRQPRMPKQNAKLRATGAGVRSPGTHGFLRTTVFDRERGTVNPVDYRATKSQRAAPNPVPAQYAGGRTSPKVAALVNECNERAAGSSKRSPTARKRQRRNRRAKERRAAVAAATHALQCALRQAHREERVRENRINAAAQREWQLAFEEMAAQLGNAVR